MLLANLHRNGHIAAMRTSRPFSGVIDLLRRADLRPTRQRLALAKLLFENGDRHVTAEGLHEEALDKNFDVSLATVYNTLHQFVQAGLLREIFVDASRSYFDTNTTEHHHFYLRVVRAGSRTYPPTRWLFPNCRRRPRHEGPPG